MTLRSFQKMSWVPLPWWTSKSTMATRSTPWAACAWRAATAALLKKQKPIGVAASAWWPGGRVATKALSTRRVDDLVDGERRAAGRAQRRLAGAGRHRGVGIELDRALARAGALGSPRHSRADGRASAPRSRRAARRRARAAGTFRPRAPGRRRAIARAARDGPRPCRARSRPDASRATSSTDAPLPDGRFIAAGASPEPPPMSTIVDPRSGLHGVGGSVAQVSALHLVGRRRIEARQLAERAHDHETLRRSARRREDPAKDRPRRRGRRARAIERA